MRAIDADALNSMKFHDLPYTHIIPHGCEPKSYERGWNDAIDSIVDGEPTIEPERKRGTWIYDTERIMHDGWIYNQYHCSLCNYQVIGGLQNFCPYCGADMRTKGNENV